MREQGYSRVQMEEAKTLRLGSAQLLCLYQCEDSLTIMTNSMTLTLTLTPKHVLSLDVQRLFWPSLCNIFK